MAISISEQYPGKTAGTNTEYPYGQARNVSAPGDGTGTPFEQALVNDDQGFKQALLKAAALVPSGAPDTAVASQYLQALQKLFAGAATAVFGNPANIVIPVFVSGVARNLVIKMGSTGSLPFDSTTEVTFAQAFPNAILWASASPKVGNPQTYSGSSSMYTGNWSTTGMQITHDASTAREGFAASWVAVGW